MISVFPKDYNNLLNTEFNANDFNQVDGHVTQGDLLSYANLSSINIFSAMNYFMSIATDNLSSAAISFTSTINNVNSTTFNYISNLTSDVQTQINATNDTFKIYQTKVGMALYAQNSTLVDYVQTIDLTSTLSKYLTIKYADSTYQTIANCSNYLTSVSMSNYLTNSTAIATYQTITNCSNYLTNASMSNYLTTTTANLTYQTIDNCSNYLTTQSGTINQIWQSINNIRTINLNPWVNLLKNDQNTVITATTNLYFENGLNEFYMITTLNNITIYLPVITDASQLGVRLIFRRGYGQYSQNIITFMSECPGQVYNPLTCRIHILLQRDLICIQLLLFHWLIH